MIGPQVLQVFGTGHSAESGDRVPDPCGLVIAGGAARLELVRQVVASPAPLATSSADSLACTRVTYSCWPRLDPGAAAACSMRESYRCLTLLSSTTTAGDGLLLLAASPRAVRSFRKPSSTTSARLWNFLSSANGKAGRLGWNGGS